LTPSLVNATLTGVYGSLERLVASVEGSAAGASSLDRLSAAAALAARLREQADDLLDHFVRAARRDERSWAEIGQALGVSKQAAQQRFVAPVPTAPSWPEHFDPAAREALARGQQEARALGHN
jgi:hypothetical protein